MKFVMALSVITGRAKTGVSEIKHFNWAQPICLPCRGTIYEKR